MGIMNVGRRGFFKFSGATLGGSTLAALGFSAAGAQAAVRAFKLERTTETRNTCPYCSVGCGVILYTMGDKSKNTKGAVVHIEGDPDHPTNRGTLCPKGAGLIDFINAKTRLQYPQYRAPGSNEWKRMSWDDAVEKIARHVKNDRDKNFIAKNAEGTTVNRWITTGFLAASATSNETAWATYKTVRSMGMLVFDNQARV